MIKIAIVEDDKSYIATLRNYISRFMKEKGIAIDVDVFQDGNKVVFNYEPVYDIVMMDIEMPGMDGMTAAAQIRRVDEAVIIIFITNMAQYAIQGYKVHARSYILKPVNYYSFALELHEAISSLSKKVDQFLLLSVEEGKQKIQIGDILYVESQKHIMQIHTRTRVMEIRDTMKNMEEKLKEYYFVRCNVSYLVNLAYVSSIVGDMVVVEGDRLPISRQKRKNFIAALTKYIGGTMDD